MSVPTSKLSIRRLPIRWQSALHNSGPAKRSGPPQYAALRHFSVTPTSQETPKPQQPEASSSPPSTRSNIESSPSPPARADPSTDNTIPISIPGPSWLWVPLKPLSYPINAYSRAQSRRPYLTQFISSLIIYFLGDFSSQLIQQPPPPLDPKIEDHQVRDKPAPSAASSSAPPSALSAAWQKYDPLRSLRATTIGGLFSIPSYHWFLYLSSLFPTSPHLLRLSLQVLISQAIFAPLFNTYFFSMHSLLSLETPQPAKAWERVQATVPTSWWNSCKFWPVVTAVNFSFVEPRSRSVVAGCVAVIWQSYLGVVNQRAVMAERERLLGDRRMGTAVI